MLTYGPSRKPNTAKKTQGRSYVLILKIEQDCDVNNILASPTMSSALRDTSSSTATFDGPSSDSLQVENRTPEFENETLVLKRNDGVMCGSSSTRLWRCWDHLSCNGREFSSKSNLLRHQREKNKAEEVQNGLASGENSPTDDNSFSNRKGPVCVLCGASFTRNSARNTHLANQSCNRIRRYSNGRTRPSKAALLNNPNLVEGVHY